MVMLALWDRESWSTAQSSLARHSKSGFGTKCSCCDGGRGLLLADLSLAGIEKRRLEEAEKPTCYRRS